ncbi:hypothetical protein B0T10DRAFT_455498 [Thelonectria olida]|uniref:BZIP domain-containing protein n=1 Tax=Thelonectria olida TaxID=1576542 RepID=A0A9P8WAZ1_9HYPO|nr:hypothetical protein B0T10DRAFT_455498 [Thelonectria olida]
MRPQRNKKRARYAENSSSPPSERSGSVSEASMHSGDHLAKRPRLQQQNNNNSLSAQNQLQMQQQMQAMQYHQQHQHSIGGMQLALPQAMQSPPNVLVPYGSHNNSVGQHSSSPPVMLQSPPEAARAPQPQSSKLRIVNTPIENAGIFIPPALAPEEYNRRREQIALELRRRRDRAPALPRSAIADLPPKPPAEQWHTMPDEEITLDEQDAIMEANNRIAANNQRVDRERNNQAAKKSRQKRLEALDNTRTMLNDCYIEMCWWRMKAISLGASDSDYAAVPAAVKQDVLRELQKDIKDKDDVNEQLRKEEESRRRAERNRRKAVSS